VSEERADLATVRTAFIGGGNMARSLVGGLLARAHPPAAIRVADPDPEARTRIAALGNVTTTADGLDALATADIAVLAVKPQALAHALAPLAATLAQLRPLLVSIAAGVRSSAITRWSGGAAPVIRCMPNTPALVGAGISALYAGPGVGDLERARATELLNAVGQTVWVEDEAQLDTVTAVSGSGPAYFFRFLEALADAGVDAGLPRETASRLALHTALGAARMAAETGEDPAELRRQVTSRGGTTEAALAALDDARIDAIVARAVTAAAERSRQLAAELSRDA